MEKSDERTRVRDGAGFWLLVLLGGLTAFDSISIDMYLPAFTAIQTDLRMAADAMPLTLSVFLIGLAIGQAASGPLADCYGRRAPLLAGIVVFGAASAMAALATSPTVFMIARFFQGVGGATGLVIPRAIVSDIYDAARATRIYTFLIQVQSISPIVAPILGGVVLEYYGWRAIFCILGVLALIALLASHPFVPETQPAEARIKLSVRNVLGRFGELLTSPRYLGMALASGLIMATLFGYISASSFIFVSHYGQSPTAYSVIFAIFSVGMILVGQLNMYLCTRMTLKNNLYLGFGVHLLFLALTLGAFLAGFDSLMVVGGLMFLAMSSLSLLFGGLTSETMYSVAGSKAGSASAILGVVQYALGALAGMLLRLVHNETLLPPLALFLVTSVLAFVCWRYCSGMPGEEHGEETADAA